MFLRLKKNRVLLTVILSLIVVKGYGQLTVAPNKTAQELVDKLVGPNVKTLNPTLNCIGDHNGTFTAVSSNLGIGDGVILCSGDATSLAGPASLSVSSSAFSPGDPDLTILASTPTNPVQTHDACVLEFDFVPDIDSISTLHFDYVFGSEEYTSFTCTQYNDVFAFFLSGPGYNPQVNVALVPGTNIPVAINSVNGGAPTGSGDINNCTSMGPGSPFPAYFVNNLSQGGQTITLDGFTTVLQANAIVYPCDTYHMKLGIANASDDALQSGVFLRANSFTVDTVTLDLTGIIAADSGYLVEGCTPATIKAFRSQPSPQKKKICLSYGGSALNGIDYPLLPDTLIIPPNGTMASLTLFPIQDNIDEPGFETVMIRRLNCCTFEPIDSIEIKVRDSLKMELLTNDTAMCDHGIVTLHASGDPSFTYQWSPTTFISNPTDTLTTGDIYHTTTYTVTAHFQSCPDISRSFTAKVEPTPVVTISPHDTSFCLHDPYLIRADVQPDTFKDFIYTWTPNLGLDDPSLLEPYFYTLNPGVYPFKLTVTTPIGCTGSDSATITTRPAPELTDVSSDFTAKYGEVVSLHAAGATFYTWTPTRLLDFPDEPDPHATAIDTATFQVIGTDQYGCRDTAYVKMDVDYTMTESIASAFSPNNDGRNDVFHISNLKYQRVIEFRVFNRWGQEVFSTTDGAKGWDGTFKGAPQEVGVYHYLIRITTPEGKMRTYKGDVTLIR